MVFEMEERHLLELGHRALRAITSLRAPLQLLRVLAIELLVGAEVLGRAMEGAKQGVDPLLQQEAHR